MVTRKDIAELAGVSISVVSRALNNSGYVEKKKKEMIIHIANELGYSPHPVAMSLQQRRSKQILFYCKDLQNDFNIELYRGMMDIAKQRGYMVVMNGLLEFTDIKNMMIDGIIMPNENTAEAYLETIGKNYYLPMVTAGYQNPVYFSKSTPIVEVDIYKAMVVAVNYLRKKGHEKIALAIPYGFSDPNSRTYAYIELLQPILKDKLKEYVIGVTRKDLGEDSRLLNFLEERIGDLITVEESYYEKGRLAAELFCERKLDATALICFNDELALGVCNKFQQLGIRIPEDISIIGFDGINARKYVIPSLTTVRLFPYNQGRKCLEILLDMIEGKKIKYVTHLSVELLEGESVKDLNINSERGVVK